MDDKRLIRLPHEPTAIQVAKEQADIAKFSPEQIMAMVEGEAPKMTATQFASKVGSAVQPWGMCGKCGTTHGTVLASVPANEVLTSDHDHDAAYDSVVVGHVLVLWVRRHADEKRVGVYDGWVML